jgi:hypothetical protein
MSNNNGKRINDLTGNPLKFAGVTQFAGAKVDAPIIGKDVITVHVKRLKSIDGAIGANYVTRIGQQVKVRLSSQMIYDVIDKEKGINRKTATIDIVDENGRRIGWEVAEMFFSEGTNK